MDRKIILGIGNLLNRDEAVGIHAIHALQKKNAVGDFETIDVGVDLSPTVANMLTRLITRAEEIAREWEHA